MLVKPIVFGSQNCLFEQIWRFVQCYWNPSFDTVLGNQFAVVRVNSHRCLQADILKDNHAGQIGFDIEIDTR